MPVAPEVFDIWTCLLCALGADARVPKEQTPEVHTQLREGGGLNSSFVSTN